MNNNDVLNIKFRFLNFGGRTKNTFSDFRNAKTKTIVTRYLGKQKKKKPTKRIISKEKNAIKRATVEG